MIPPLEGLTAAWPVLVTIACAVAIDRRRERRRRLTLNRTLHELRRPLQFLALAWSASIASTQRDLATTRGQLEAALGALADLDAEINGRPSARPRAVLRAEELVGQAVERWRAAAALFGRDLELRWSAGDARVAGDPEALSRALDNLVANAIEHGAGPIRIEASTVEGRLRIVVVDWGHGNGSLLATGRRPRRLVAVDGIGLDPPPDHRRAGDAGGRDSRRGHGFAVVTRIASGHGGSFEFSQQATRASSVLELPLAVRPPRALRHEARCDLA